MTTVTQQKILTQHSKDWLPLLERRANEREVRAKCRQFAIGLVFVALCALAWIVA